MGDRFGCSAFYTAFLLAPVASNASELITSYSYAKKKTTRSISISLQALQGAACMNNTFCLAIFMALIYFKGLVWTFTAETIGILASQLVVALYSFKETQRVFDAYVGHHHPTPPPHHLTNAPTHQHPQVRRLPHVPRLPRPCRDTGGVRDEMRSKPTADPVTWKLIIRMDEQYNPDSKSAPVPTAQTCLSPGNNLTGQRPRAPAGFKPATNTHTAQSITFPLTNRLVVTSRL